MAAVLRSSEPKGSARWVLFMIAYRFNDDRGYAWPAIRGPHGLAANVGLSPRRVVDILHDLEADHWVAIHRRIGKSSQYKINWARLAEHTPHSAGGAIISPPPPKAPRVAGGGEAGFTPGGEKIAPIKTEDLHDPQGCTSSGEDSGSGPLEADVPEWAEPGVRASLRWAGEWIVVELLELDDGTLGFLHPQLQRPMHAWRWWPQMRPVAAEPAAT